MRRCGGKHPGDPSLGLWACNSKPVRVRCVVQTIFGVSERSKGSSGVGLGIRESLNGLLPSTCVRARSLAPVALPLWPRAD